MSVAGRSTYAAAVDPQRSTTGVASSQGPVLAAWSVVGEPPQFPSAPFPEMPPAAAAAVSPVVPGAPAAAAPPDPYGRCWQNQVDAGACFPYFGTLYGSSLPPPSYRMQPGCMSNLGQFWPPTPPPDGCVRYDSTNNIHFCSPLTPMFRHSESLPQNMLGVHHQRLAHYSHLIDVNKDSGLKRLDACVDNTQRQKMMLPSKHSKDVLQQRLCHCYECNEKNMHGLTPNINKENIGRSFDQRYIDEKLKTKSCKRTKEENLGVPRSTPSYHPNSSAITGYSCSVDQNTARTLPNMQNPQAQDSLMRSSQKTTPAIVSSSGLQFEFPHPNSTGHSGTRCKSNSVFTVPSSNAISPVVSTSIKCSEQARYENIEKAQQRRLPTSVPGYESYSCPSVQTPASSHAHQNDKSCCFSPPYLSSRTLYNGHTENYAHSKTPNGFVLPGNNYNASPLKNVYFSYYESENFDLSSDSSARRHSRSGLGKQEKVTNNLGYLNNRPPSEKPLDYLVSSSGNYAPSESPTLNNNYSYRTQQKNTSVPLNLRGPLQQPAFIEQHKNDANFCNYLGTTSSRRSEKSAFSKQLGKTNSAFIKQEKAETFDCKFQKSIVDDSVRIPPLPASSISNEVLNLSTSLRCPKLEPSDSHYEESSNALPQSYHNTTFSSSVVSTTLSCVSAPTVTCKSSESATQQMNDVTSSYLSNVLPFCSLDKNHDATSLRMQRLENQCAPVVPEDLVSVGQVAPTVDELVILNKMPSTGSEAPLDMVPITTAADAEKTDATSKLHQESASSFVAVQPMESADIGQYAVHVEKYQVSPVSQNKRETGVSGTCTPCNEICDESTLYQDHKRATTIKDQSNMPIVQPGDHELRDVTETMDLVKIKTEELVLSGFNELGTVINSQIIPTCTPLTNDEKQQCVSTKQDLLDDAAKSSIDEIKMEMEDKRPNDYHGLYLLLQGIDQKCNMDESIVKEQVLNDSRDTDAVDRCKTPNCNIETSPKVSMPEASNMKGLNLLCALVEEQFVKEFGSGKNNGVEETGDREPADGLKSNYPDIEVNEASASHPVTPDAIVEPLLVSEGDANFVEMRKKLVELQHQYKEKQKELARLRPKKNGVVELSKKNVESVSLGSKSLVSLDTSASSSFSASSESTLLSPTSSSCSKGSIFASENTPTATQPNEQSNLETPECKLDIVNLTPAKPAVKTPKVIPNGTSNSADESIMQCPSNDATSSANLSLKIDISLGICKTSKRTVRRSLVRRKLELRSSKHTVTVSENKATKSKLSRNYKSTRLKNSLLCAGESNRADKASDSSSLSDGVKVSANQPKKREKKAKFSKKKAAKDNSSNCIVGNMNTKERPESASDYDIAVSEAPTPAKSPKKRKAENPKKFMPSKQVRLTETIIAKQLRNRILFETPDQSQEEKQVQQEFDVPEELFDALRKCHLGESSQSTDAHDEIPTASVQSDSVCASDEQAKEVHGELRMAVTRLVENQRILALEDGLFYAGSIKEIQNDNMYGIVLDGQRGNKKHMFTRDEMLTQTILEQKPMSVEELPEGTRICAYWSHQYRCLYPGTVVKGPVMLKSQPWTAWTRPKQAPTPSVDWSEPRVFVEFDDGDSAQIATKNIRFLPSDMQLSDDVDSEASMPNLIPAISQEEEEGVKETAPNEGKRKKRGMIRFSRKHAKLNKMENESSKTSCSNSHPFDICSTKEFTPSTSHGSEPDVNGEDLTTSPARKGNKGALSQISPKRSPESRSKSKENGLVLEKNKKHKKYKDRHKHHHHHHRHRHHHRHCHRHRHCRKHKHHKKATMIGDEPSVVNGVILPSSTSIPFGDTVTAKSTRSSARDSENHYLGHSRKAKLPHAANGAKSLEPHVTTDKFSIKLDDNGHSS